MIKPLKILTIISLLFCCSCYTTRDADNKHFHLRFSFQEEVNSKIKKVNQQIDFVNSFVPENLNSLTYDDLNQNKIFFVLNQIPIINSITNKIFILLNYNLSPQQKLCSIVLGQIEGFSKLFLVCEFNLLKKS
ncbi:MAG: hypothetical protein HC875_20750 [Anaerolineales bacterium]|nr:hypothetical protein [Anaerolineales bacterium]